MVFFLRLRKRESRRRRRRLFPISKPTYLALKTAAAATAAASRRAALRGTSTASIAGVTALATEEGLASGIIIVFFSIGTKRKFFLFFVLVASRLALTVFLFPFFPDRFTSSSVLRYTKEKGGKATTTHHSKALFHFRRDQHGERTREKRKTKLPPRPR